MRRRVKLTFDWRHVQMRHITRPLVNEHPVVGQRCRGAQSLTLYPRHTYIIQLLIYLFIHLYSSLEIS